MNAMTVLFYKAINKIRALRVDGKGMQMLFAVKP